MITDLLLGIDIGTSDTKVLATALDGREIAWVAAAPAVVFLSPGALVILIPDREG